MILIEARYLPGSYGYYRLGGGWWTLLSCWTVEDAERGAGHRRGLKGIMQFRIREGKYPARMVGPQMRMARGKPLSAEQTARAKDMRAKGIHWQVIADLLECCAPTVKKYVRGANAQA